MPIPRPNRGSLARYNGTCYAIHCEGCAVKGIRCMVPCAVPCCGCTDQVVCVEEDQIGIITDFSKPMTVAAPGIHYLPNAVSCLSGCGVHMDARLSTRLMMITKDTNTKTADDVFVTISTAVQYQIIVEQAMNAFYKLSSPAGQIGSAVEDSVRVYVGKFTLDELFMNRQDMSDYVVERLRPQMEEYGWHIVNALIIRLDPAVNVRIAMNNINIQARLKVAERERAEADKIIDIKRAEGRAEATYLSGEGTSRMRQALMGGYAEMVSDFSADTGLDERIAENIVYSTQLFDTMRDLATDDSPDVLYLDPRPGVIFDYQREIDEMLFGSSEVAQAVRFKPASELAKATELEDPWPEFLEPEEYHVRGEPPLPRFTTNVHVHMVDADDPMLAPDAMTMEEREAQEKRRPDFIAPFAPADAATPRGAAEAKKAFREYETSSPVHPFAASALPPPSPRSANAPGKAKFPFRAAGMVVRSPKEGAPATSGVTIASQSHGDDPPEGSAESK